MCGTFQERHSQFIRIVRPEILLWTCWFLWPVDGRECDVIRHVSGKYLQWVNASGWAGSHEKFIWCYLYFGFCKAHRINEVKLGWFVSFLANFKGWLVCSLSPLILLECLWGDLFGPCSALSIRTYPRFIRPSAARSHFGNSFWNSIFFFEKICHSVIFRLKTFSSLYLVNILQNVNCHEMSAWGRSLLNLSWIHWTGDE